MIVAFICLMILFSATDISFYYIPNLVVLPAIVVGVTITGYWLAALVMGWVGIWLYKRNKICGGDVKLLALCGAFIGPWSLPAFILSRFFVYLFRTALNKTGMLPYAPFLTLGCVPFMFVK